MGTAGALTELYVEPGTATYTWDTSSERYEFVREALVNQETILDTNAIRGTRSHHEIKTRFGVKEIGGPVVMHPTPASLDLWLPRILGASEATDVFALAETLQQFGVLIDRGGGTFEYQDCQVNRAVFRGQETGLVEMELDIWAVDEATGVSTPSVSLGTAAADAPYVFSDGVLTLQSGTREMMDFEIVIENRLNRRYANSRTVTDLVPQDRLVTLRTTNPFTSTELSALYGQSLSGATGTLVLTNGNMSTTFTFGTLQVPNRSPQVGGKDEVPLVLEMTARMTGSTRELEVTHDSTA